MCFFFFFQILFHTKMSAYRKFPASHIYLYLQYNYLTDKTEGISCWAFVSLTTKDKCLHVYVYIHTNIWILHYPWASEPIAMETTPSRAVRSEWHHIHFNSRVIQGKSASHLKEVQVKRRPSQVSGHKTHSSQIMSHSVQVIQNTYKSKSEVIHYKSMSNHPRQGREPSRVLGQEKSWKTSKSKSFERSQVLSQVIWGSKQVQVKVLSH